MQFDEIHHKIQKFISSQKIEAYSLEDTQYKLPLSDALFCATDAPRNRAFFVAIQKAISDLQEKTDSVHVVYAGSGTGILGIFALACGADSAVFLEHNPYSLDYSKKLSRYCGYADRIKFIKCDATTLKLETSYNLLISETLTSGFVREEFPLIVNNLVHFRAKNSVILPQKFVLTLEEKNNSEECIRVQEFSFHSKNGFPKIGLFLHKNTTQLLWKTICTLYDDIVLSSGSCISFLNQTQQKRDGFHHPFFFIEDE